LLLLCSLADVYALVLHEIVWASENRVDLDDELPAMAAAQDADCRLPAAWDHRAGFSATRMGPPGCQ
jgi:hypothetical protein